MALLQHYGYHDMLIVITHWHYRWVSLWLFLSLGACIVLSGTLKANNQAEEFWSDSVWGLLVPVAKVHSIFINNDFPSSSRESPKKITMTSKVFGVFWKILTNYSKEGFSYLVYRCVRLSKAHRGSIVITDEKILFKLYMYIYISSYMYYYKYL